MDCTLVDFVVTNELLIKTEGSNPSFTPFPLLGALHFKLLPNLTA